MTIGRRHHDGPRLSRLIQTPCIETGGIQRIVAGEATEFRPLAEDLKVCLLQHGDRQRVSIPSVFENLDGSFGVFAGPLAIARKRCPAVRSRDVRQDGDIVWIRFKQRFQCVQLRLDSHIVLL